MATAFDITRAAASVYAESLLQLAEEAGKAEEIGDELHLSAETVTWLLTRGVKGGEPPKDVKIGWRSVGVFGNRIGFVAGVSLAQLKIMQEVITLAVFVPFAVVYMQQPLKLDYLWAALCLVGAVYFIFRA